MSDPIKMYGPYKHIEDAAKAGFKKVKADPQWLEHRVRLLGGHQADSGQDAHVLLHRAANQR